LLDGDRLIAWIDDMSPLKHGRTRELLAEFKRVSYAVILSTIITAAVQALVALVGYLIARVPHVLFFTGATFIVAFVPALGAGTVCPAVALMRSASGKAARAAWAGCPSTRNPFGRAGCALATARSIVGTSAILPSPNRICKMADNKPYVNYTHLHTQTIPMPERRRW
jgi:Predicted permease